MPRRSDRRVPPSWTAPGNRWGPWIYWPMLGAAVGLLVWRVADGASTGGVLVPAALVLVWVCLLVANRSARRRHTGTRTPPR
ncbi:hypothetical protein [Streptomyces pilosus]|uniref:Uncharacterized protein n=1 Tax=Streptomyces pilosus TaxID=28893 RepID=A0A918BJ88_9ACTN|nr:hypothetical protein [Streptomyces pilosus]GGQ69971.1 hypothetical protein GCM10010280_15480 [Streptomyces pilosus]GGV54969.1 hypothetical protein GCM10010261_38390 [Streptomyces pilosus]